MAAVHVPVVSRADYALDAAAPGGTLAPPSSAASTAGSTAWTFATATASTSTAAPTSEAARAQVADIAGNYGLLVSQGAPVTAGAVGSGNVRVVVTRNVASVPDCPNWAAQVAAQFQQPDAANYGCGVNSNLAAMVAEPRGSDPRARGQRHRRCGNGSQGDQHLSRPHRPTGSKGLQDISTKKEEK